MPRFVAPLLAFVVAAAPLVAADPPAGRRVFSAGHSFHMPMPSPLAQVARAAGIADHKVAGTQGIGGSTVTQHWDRADETNAAKKALATGAVDVLTLSPHLLMPDPAIDKFTDLMLKHNPAGRVTVQASWYPYDVPPTAGKKFANADRDAADPEALRTVWNVWYAKVRAQATAINEKHKKPVVSVVPVGEAVLRLRAKVAKGEVPGYAKQSDLFTDPIGHGQPPIAWVTAYCHFAVIYGRNPAGLPAPDALRKLAGKDADRLTAILQEVAWQAVLSEPLSGVKAK